jgi:hypothetical protein
MILNGSISFFWALGLALLSWSVSTSHVLEKQCTGKVWGGVAEAGVCRDYKALWSMTLIGTYVNHFLSSPLTHERRRFLTRKYRFSTFCALLLDIHTHRKSNRRGAYLMPEDDKDAQRLNDLKSARVRSAGYDAPADQSAVSSSIFDSDIGYHNRYGVEETDETEMMPHGPLDDHEAQAQKDMGYHNQFFRD